jgi:hypothetical protein
MSVTRVGRRLGALSALCVILAVSGADAVAQTVEFRRGTRGDAVADGVLTRVLERGNYRVLTGDSVLAAGDVMVGDVILIGGALRVEGRIEGSLVGVQSDIFARPGGRFDGAVAVLGGGFYGSSLAQLDSPVVDASRVAYRVEVTEDGTYVISAPGGKTAVRLPGLYGFLMPQYDRVNAVTFVWGIGLEPGPQAWIPEAAARVRFYTVREAFDGELELKWRFGRQAVIVRGGRVVRSNDRWINSDLENSLYALIGGIDTRNYYDARFAEAVIRLETGTHYRWTNDLIAGWERADSLVNRDPFSIFSVRGGFQPNAPVTPADAASLALQSVFQFRDRRLSKLEIEMSVEHADQEVAGDLSFTLFGAAARADLRVGSEATLVLEARGQAPTSSGAPAQRWRALGGWGTVPTLLPVGRQGDRMWWGAATYRLPLARVGARWRLVPWLQYAAGNAWVDEGQRPPAVHNLAAGLSLGPLALGIFSDPSDDFRTVLSLGFDRYR